MSAELLGWAYRQKTGSSITKGVLVKLTDNANDQGYCYPSVTHIATFMELSERAVREHIRKLEALGLVKVKRQKIDEKVNLPNAYFLQIDGVSNLGIITAGRGSGEQDAPSPVGGGEQSAIGDGEQGAAKPLVTNPQIKEPLLGVLAPVGANSPSELDLCVAAYNEVAGLTNGYWPIARVAPGDGRLPALKKRLASVGLDGWRAAMERAVKSDFLAGRTRRSSGHENWKPDLEWFAKAANFTKLVEGKYDNVAGQGGSKAMDTLTRGMAGALNS